MHRINAAHQLLRDEMTLVEAADVLSARFAVGRRQAFRYLEEACQVSSPLKAPEPKGVFTVKLPVSLIDQLRSYPRRPKQSLSDFVCQALRRSLEDQSPQRGRPKS